jgi:uncharacterized protein (DUF58 family)
MRRGMRSLRPPESGRRTSLWQQLRSAIARRIRYKVTRGGVLFTFAILVVGLGAIVSANNLLFLIVATMLATLLVSGFVSRLCLAGLELDFQVPDHVPAKRPVPGKIYVHNQKWLMPSFSIRVEAIRDPGSPTLRSGVYFPLVAANATVDETVEARFPRRGAYRQNSFAFSTSFPFGFLEKTARVTLSKEMIVYPSIDPQPGFDDLLAGIMGEIESARHVDWKASAHVGSLQVREFAREQEQTVEIFLDRDVPAHLDAWFEHSIDCCAFLAWSFSNHGASIHFRSNGFEFRQPEDGDIFAILKYLALVYPQGGNPPEPPLDDDSYKIVFTASPQRFLDAGWMGARVLGPELLG